MDEEELRSQLVERLLSRYAPVFEPREQVAPGELEGRMESFIAELPEAARAVFKEITQEHRSSSRPPRWRNGPSMLYTAIDSKANELLPHLVKARSESGNLGPIADDEYYEACHSASRSSIDQSLAEIEQRLESTNLDPRRRAVLTMLAQQVSENKSLRDGLADNPSEEKQTAFADNSC